MSGHYEVLAHTADTAIAVEADSLGELFAWAARGMFATMYALDRPATEDHTITVASSASEELMVDVLSELLFISESEDVVPVSFSTVDAGELRMTMRVGTVPLAAMALEGPPIKAVTYHDLSVEQRSDGSWAAHVVFDV